jgi:hemin uptake protein HemP
VTKERTVESTVDMTDGRKLLPEAIPTRTAQELLGERGVLRIEHEGELYTLRITRNNRLILTK